MELIRMAVAEVSTSKMTIWKSFCLIWHSDTPIKKCISEDLADILSGLERFYQCISIGTE